MKELVDRVLQVFGWLSNKASKLFFEYNPENIGLVEKVGMRWSGVPAVGY